MQWIKAHRNRIIAGVVIFLVLLAAFFFKTPGQGKQEPAGDRAIRGIVQGSIEVGEDFASASEADRNAGTRVSAGEQELADDRRPSEPEREYAADNTEPGTRQGSGDSSGFSASGAAGEISDPAADASSGATSASDTAEAPAENSFTCTISISCATIGNHMDALKPEKAGLVPADGWILGSSAVTVTEGETVYDALRRACSEAGIPLDASYSPGYGTAYVRGIGNIYEFDCGSLSGWRYCVNGVYPNYGCSSYVLQEGDSIQWNYTCDMNDL